MWPHQWTIYLVTSFLLGNLFASRISLNPLSLNLWLVIVALVLVVFFHLRSVRVICLGLAFALLGMARLTHIEAEWSSGVSHAPIGSQLATIEILDINLTSPTKSTLIALDHNSGLRYQLAYWDPTPLMIGDVLEAKLSLKRPPDNNYYIAHDIHATGELNEITRADLPPHKSINRILGNLRTDLHGVINSLSPPSISPLLAGLLLGIKASLGKQLQDQLAYSGTTHIVALSGFNITLIIIVLMRLGRLLPKNIRLAGSGLIILAFIIMTGLSASVVRAAVMGWLLLLSGIWGRPIHPGSVLLVAAASMVAVHPVILVYDIGFQLSVIATAGLITLSGPVSAYLPKPLTKLPAVLTETLIATVAATVVTVPLTAHYFGGISLVSLLANITIVPLVPIAMLSGSLGILLASITGWAGPILPVLWLPTRAILALIEFWGQPRAAYLTVSQVSPVVIIGWYAVIATFIFRHAHLTPFAAAPSNNRDDAARDHLSLP